MSSIWAMVRDGLLGSITKLEYVETSSIVLFPDVLADGKSDGYIQLTFGQAWTEMELSAGKQGVDWNNAGFISDATAQISIKLMEITPENQLLVRALKEKELVFRATDAQGRQWIIGSVDFPAFINFNSNIGSAPETANGVNVSISASATRGAVLHTAVEVENAVVFNGLYLTINGQYLTFNG